MNLSPEQKKRVETFIYDEWVDDKDDEKKSISNLKKLLNEVQHPIEIDCMLRGFNWDCGIDGLDFILTHPMTDTATKLRAFWMAGPGYFCQYEKERDISEYELDEWEAIQLLQKHATSSIRQSGQLQFDPKKDEEGYDWTSQYSREESKMSERGKKSFYTIPSELYNAVKSKNTHD